MSESDSKPVPPTVAELRSATLGSSKQFKRELVDVGGVTVEVRQPNVRQRGEILKAAKAMTGDAEKMDLSAMQAQAVIGCCFRPGTEEKVFNAADWDSLMSEPSGGWMDDVAEVALKLLNVDAEVAAKN